MKGVFTFKPKIVPMVWLCYELGERLNLKSEFLSDACSSCGRVSSENVHSRRSFKVAGLNRYKFPVLVTEDNYCLYSTKLIDAIEHAGIGGLNFIPVTGTRYCVGWTDNLIAVDDSQMKRPKGICAACGRPHSAFGSVRLIEKPEGRAFYGLSAEFYTGHSGRRFVVCNEIVFDDLAANGFELCLQAIETIEPLGGKWVEPSDQ